MIVVMVGLVELTHQSHKQPHRARAVPGVDSHKEIVAQAGRPTQRPNRRQKQRRPAAAVVGVVSQRADRVHRPIPPRARRRKPVSVKATATAGSNNRDSSTKPRRLQLHPHEPLESVCRASLKFDRASKFRPFGRSKQNSKLVSKKALQEFEVRSVPRQSESLHLTCNQGYPSALGIARGSGSSVTFSNLHSNVTNRV